MIPAYTRRDADLMATRALPNGAANVTSDAIDTEHNNAKNHFLAGCEFEIQAPAVNTTQLPNSQTLTYDILSSDNSDLSSPTTHAAVLVQTGAGGAGADAATVRFRPPTDAKRYWGIKVTKSGAGDASASSAVFSLVF